MTTNAVGEKGPEILTGASPPSFGQYPKENPLFPGKLPQNLFIKIFRSGEPFVALLRQGLA